MLISYIQITIAILVLATGLSSSRNDLLWLLRRPALLGQSFAAMYLFVPLVADAIVSIFDVLHEDNRKIRKVEDEFWADDLQFDSQEIG